MRAPRNPCVYGGGGRSPTVPSLTALPRENVSGAHTLPSSQIQTLGAWPQPGSLHSNTPICPGVRGSILARHGPHPWAWLRWTQDQCPQSKVGHDRPTGRDCLPSPRHPRVFTLGSSEAPGVSASSRTLEAKP